MKNWVSARTLDGMSGPGPIGGYVTVGIGLGTLSRNRVGSARPRYRRGYTGGSECGRTNRSRSEPNHDVGGGPRPRPPCCCSGARGARPRGTTEIGKVLPRPTACAPSGQSPSGQSPGVLAPSGQSPNGQSPGVVSPGGLFPCLRGGTLARMTFAAPLRPDRPRRSAAAVVAAAGHATFPKAGDLPRDQTAARPERDRGFPGPHSLVAAAAAHDRRRPGHSRAGSSRARQHGLPRRVRSGLAGIDNGWSRPPPTGRAACKWPTPSSTEPPRRPRRRPARHRPRGKRLRPQSHGAHVRRRPPRVDRRAASRALAVRSRRRRPQHGHIQEPRSSTSPTA